MNITDEQKSWLDSMNTHLVDSFSDEDFTFDVFFQILFLERYLGERGSLPPLGSKELENAPDAIEFYQKKLVPNIGVFPSQ